MKTAKAHRTSSVGSNGDTRIIQTHCGAGADNKVMQASRLNLDFAHLNIVSGLEPPNGLFSTLNEGHLFSRLYQSLLLYINRENISYLEWTVD